MQAMKRRASEFKNMGVRTQEGIKIDNQDIPHHISSMI